MYKNFVKRFFDIILSLLGMIILSPLFLCVALAIKIDDGGPVFFKQKRVGANKSHFWLYKFRSMKTNTPDVPTHLFNEPEKYISRVGGVIRKLSIDELPQLWNILKGDMSFVGPRPLISSEIRAHRLRLEYGVYRFRPGLTGWAQINGRDDISIMKKMKLDKEYCDNWSIGLDLKILFKSVEVCIKQEGFHEGKIHRR